MTLGRSTYPPVFWLLKLVTEGVLEGCSFRSWLQWYLPSMGSSSDVTLTPFPLRGRVCALPPLPQSLNLDRPLWLPWQKDYGRTVALWLLSFDHKNPMCLIFLLLLFYWLSYILVDSLRPFKTMCYFTGTRRLWNSNKVTQDAKKPCVDDKIKKTY